MTTAPDDDRPQQHQGPDAPTELDEIQRRLAHLARENARLREHARRLRAALGPGKQHRIVWNAAEDAELILHLRHAGETHSRAWLDEAGLITDWRHGWALGILRYARLATTRPRDLEHLARCIDRLNAARDRLLALPPDDAVTTMRALAGQKYVHNAGLFRAQRDASSQRGRAETPNGQRHTTPETPAIERTPAQRERRPHDDAHGTR